MPKICPKIHAYDYERTAKDGCRVMCGRDTRDVVVADFSERKTKVTCQLCKRALKARGSE